MALDPTILSDDSRLSRLDRIFHHAETWLSLAGGVVIFLLVLLASMNVLGRWLFSMPVDGYIDWVEQAMAGIAFLGIAYTQRLGGHIRMDIFVGALRGRWLWLTEFISTSVMLLVTLVMIYGSYFHFLRAYQIGDSSVDINLPTWPAKLIVPFALSVLALRLMLQLWGFARAFKRNQDRPVAVPLVEDAATIAAREAEALGSDK